MIISFAGGLEPASSVFKHRHGVFQDHSRIIRIVLPRPMDRVLSRSERLDWSMMGATL
jgi:hypothetical protein